jgi:hypothetical protein
MTTKIIKVLLTISARDQQSCPTTSVLTFNSNVTTVTRMLIKQCLVHHFNDPDYEMYEGSDKVFTNGQTGVLYSEEHDFFFTIISVDF